MYTSFFSFLILPGSTLTDLAGSLPPDSVLVSCGNPTVEKLVGIVHLFREVEATADPGALEKSSTSVIPDAAADAPSYRTAVTRGPGSTRSAAVTAAIASAQTAQRSAQQLPEGRGAELLCLGVPADCSLADFCAFLGAHLARVRHIRILRREVGGELTSYMTLLRMDSVADADSLYTAKNGRPFSSLEPELLCRLGFVKDVQISGLKDEEVLAHPGPNPAAGATIELPSCPVCLDRLDEHVTGLVTTICNHSFHSQCLLKWGDASCPVCRYCQQPGQASRCSTCGASSNLWICLICGHVGCGRYEAGHAKQHFCDTDHAYALELESHKIWSYVGDQWVHRLVQSKATGHLVEVPSPHRGGGEGAGGGRPVGACRLSSRLSRAAAPCAVDDEDASGGPDASESGDEELDEVLRTSKMDSIALEYEHLLTSQLDSQREFFTTQLARMESEYEHRLLSADESIGRLQHELHDFRLLQSELSKDRVSLQRKLEAAREEAATASKERDFLKQLSDSLLQNQKEWKEKLTALQAKSAEDVADRDAKIADLEEQVRDLMMFLEGRRMVEEHGGELEGASLLPSPGQQAAGGSGGRGRGAKRAVGGTSKGAGGSSGKKK